MRGNGLETSDPSLSIRSIVRTGSSPFDDPHRSAESAGKRLAPEKVLGVACRLRCAGQVERFFDRELAAGFGHACDLVRGERCVRLIDELAPRSVFCVDDGDALL